MKSLKASRRVHAFFLGACRILCVAAVSFLLPACDDDEDDTGSASTFNFVPDAASAFTRRADRTGMPAVATAVITPAMRDAFNQANPVDDVAGDFVADITANVTNLHNILDDDLMGAGLTPCATNDCIGQAAPLVVPDALTITPGMPAGFPNGRRLEDSVVDLTLAVILLDLDVHAVATLADLPLGPQANESAFSPDFPFLADPQD